MIPFSFLVSPQLT